MNGFGKRGGGGRRGSNRVEGPLLATLTTLRHAKSGVLLDLSCSGARVSGDELPVKGQELFLRIGAVEVFASVVWKRGNEAGLAFDEPIDAPTVEQARKRAAAIKLMQLTPDEKLALDQWMVGNVG